MLLDYCAQAATTRAPATVKAIASHLAGFGRFLTTCAPPLTDLTGLDRQRHIEPWLTALADARHDDSTAMSVGHRRGQILTVRLFLAEIAEWGWPSAPTRTLIFSRDIPRAPHPLPRYLPPDADRRLLTALQHLSQDGPTPLGRLHADALLLARATGVRIGELRDLELDCVHQIDGHGAWLKVPLGKLGTERMVPLDEETVTVVDRLTARRTPGRPLPHPRTGRPVAFLLVHQGRRLSAQALREELARACDTADLPKITPHALRHTFATGLVNAGVSLQALMQLLGHISAAMSLRYGRLFDSTVREEYERALTQTKAQLAAVPVAPAGPVGVGTPLPLVQVTGGADWKDTATIKVPPQWRVLYACTRSGILRLCQHLRALPELPHRQRLPVGPWCSARRHPCAGGGRRRSRLEQRSRPAPPARRPARPADQPRQRRSAMSHTSPERVRAACEQLLADGRDVTFTAVAQTSGISRATCYRDRGLRAVIDTYRARHGEVLTLTSLADRVDHLTASLEAVAAKVRRQEDELRTLKRASTTRRQRSRPAD